MYYDEHRERDDRIACRSCGESFPAPEGAALIWVLKDSCPRCGGELLLLLEDAPKASPARDRAHAA